MKISFNFFTRSSLVSFISKYCWH